MVEPAGGLSIEEKASVALILAVLAGTALVEGLLTTRCDPPRSKMTEAILQQLSFRVELFKLEQGRYPASLGDLVRRPDDVDPEKWPSGGYLPEDPCDGWGRPFRYRLPGVGASFDVVSWGEDGQPGGEGVDADLWSRPPH